jgi:hypothetical protein
LANNTLSGALLLLPSPSKPVLQVLDVSTNKLTAGLDGLAEQKVRGGSWQWGVDSTETGCMIAQHQTQVLNIACVSNHFKQWQQQALWPAHVQAQYGMACCESEVHAWR